MTNAEVCLWAEHVHRHVSISDAISTFDNNICIVDCVMAQTSAFPKQVKMRLPVTISLNVPATMNVSAEVS